MKVILKFYNSIAYNILKLIDSKMLELRTPMYQRVYQYLQLFDEKNYLGLDKFIFLGTLVGKDKECLQTIIR